MTKSVYMFGRNSEKKARQYVQEYTTRDLVILKDTRTWRIAVCSPHMAEELIAQGFRPIDSEDTK